LLQIKFQIELFRKLSSSIKGDKMQDLSKEMTLVTVTYNSAEVLPGHIDSMRNAATGPLPRWLIVDNASSDQSEVLLQKYGKDVELIKNTDNLGFGAACNIGIAASTTRYVMILNPDTQLSEAAVQQLLAELKTQGATIAGPALEPAVDQSIEAVDWLVGAVLLFDKEKMDPIGYFDEQFFLYEEDKDICKCANDAGLKVIHCRNVSIPHVGGGSTVRSGAVNEFIHFHKGRSFALYALKHGLPDGVLNKYVRDNSRRKWVALLSCGRSRYLRARAKIMGVHSLNQKGAHS
jgi:N-acetylglucosaminyl-diphospho-decaprenol L-rhamnosyltransferase